MKLLPLPLDIINIIMSYIIQPIPKTDERYELLRTIPRKRTCNSSEYVIFSNNRFVFIVNIKPSLVYYKFVDLDNNNEHEQEYFLF